MLLPAAFRSLSRPSSASGAKASALCSYSLNLLARLLYPRLRCCSSLRCSCTCVHSAPRSSHALPGLQNPSQVLSFHYCFRSFVKIFWYSSRLLKLKLLPFSFFKKTNFLLISLSLSLFLYSVFMVRNSAYKCAVVGLGGLEPPTSRLSGVRSNHLSYKPICLSFEPPASVDACRLSLFKILEQT